LNLSPASNLKCDTIHAGTVVRKESDKVVALCNVVSVNESPNKDIDLLPYKSTYYSTNKLKYSETYIGIRIGRKVIKMTIHNPRQLRGLAILSSGLEAIKRIDKKHYKVKSQHGNHYYDIVKKYGIGWTCTCPNWIEYQSDCKHIYAVHFSMQLRLEIEKEINPNKILEATNTIECPECSCKRIVKNGQRKCKKGINQRYKCRVCGHRFVVEKELSRLKATPEVISVSMDLYFKGNSLSKIQHHLKMFYNTKVARNTILSWIQKFSTILNEYSDRHKPKVGDLWNSDEMTIGIREKDKKGNKEWIWNLMDSETRYLLASRITKNRFVKDARKPLRDAKKRAGKKPKAVITDGLHSYNDGINKEMYTRKDPTIHFRTTSKRKYFLNQNIERLNGTWRERLKVMRGVNSESTGQIIMDGERFYYNHIRPHISLNNMTPAQVANLPFVPVENNPWLTYLRVALKEKNSMSRHRTTKAN
jgi:transposase-like protein